jgi:FMN phosphatase YigB (HAD superfamily)
VFRNSLSPCFGARNRKLHRGEHNKEGISSHVSNVTNIKDVESLSLTPSEEWWYDVVSRTVLGAAAATTTASALTEDGISTALKEELSQRMPSLFASLYRRVFMSRDVWAVYPNVHETLAALRGYRSEMRGSGALGLPLQLGIISNSDDRTAALLEGLL